MSATVEKASSKDAGATDGPIARFGKFLINNYPDFLFGVIRNTRPNLSLPGSGGPVFVTRYYDVCEALNRPEFFNVIYAPMMDPSVGPFMLGRDDTTINQRDKGIMRALIQREDLPRVRDLVARITKDAIRPHLSNGEIDVVKHVSRHVPMRLTGNYFGFPGPDIDTMLRWSFTTQHDMFRNADENKLVHEANLQSGREMKSYLDTWIPQRREELKINPELDDILCRLLKLETPKEIGFGEQRIASNIMGTLVGGGETTSQAVAQILVQLFKRPAQLRGAIDAAKAGDDETLYAYCWEALRFDPITPFVARLCVKDYKLASGTLRSLKVKAGQTVLISTRSAMKDGRVLQSPRSFRIDRPEYHYLNTGYGHHTCLGDHVSRVQVPEMIKHLLLLPGVRQHQGITTDGSPHLARGEKSPFPESYVLKFDAR